MEFKYKIRYRMDRLGYEMTVYDLTTGCLMRWILDDEMMNHQSLRHIRKAMVRNLKKHRAWNYRFMRWVKSGLLSVKRKMYVRH